MRSDPRSSDEELYFETNRPYVQVPIIEDPVLVSEDEPLPQSDILTLPIKEMGSMLLITDRMLRADHKEALANVVQRQLRDSFVRALVVGGQRVCGPVKQEFERDASYRAWEMITIVDTIPDHRKEALLAQAETNLEKLVMAVNSLPLWKIIWRRLRYPRTALVERPYVGVQ